MFIKTKYKNGGEDINNPILNRIIYVANILFNTSLCGFLFIERSHSQSLYLTQNFILKLVLNKIDMLLNQSYSTVFDCTNSVVSMVARREWGRSFDAFKSMYKINSCLLATNGSSWRAALSDNGSVCWLLRTARDLAIMP